MNQYTGLTLHAYGSLSRVQRLYVRRAAQPTLEGAAYFAWHRLNYGESTVCRGVHDDRVCAQRWANSSKT